METKRRTRRKPRLIKRVLLFGVTLSCLLGVSLFAQHVWMLYHAEELLLTAPVSNFRAAREIYPYSVVPGGVFDSKDVADTIAHDPVARAHYAGVHAERPAGHVPQGPGAVRLAVRTGRRQVAGRGPGAGAKSPSS